MEMAIVRMKVRVGRGIRLGVVRLGIDRMGVSGFLCLNDEGEVGVVLMTW